MSIRSDKANKATKEETPKGSTTARSSSIRHAVLFLLAQAKMNNRDISREADRHSRLIQEELDNKKPEQGVIELPAASEPVKAPEGTPAPTPTDAAPSTAELLRPSRRFKRTAS